MYKKIILKKEFIILGLIITGLFFLRIFNLQNLFYFTYDESVFAFIGRRMFVGNHIPLIGGVTPFHVHLAPYFYWLSGVLLFISKFDPIIWGFFTAIFSILTGIIIYILVRDAFSKKAALYSLFIYSFSTYIIIFDRHYWGIFFNPFLSSLVLLCLLKITQKKEKYFLPLAMALAYGFHTDPSTSVLLVLSIFTIIYFRIQLKNNLYSTLAIAIFLLSFLPLILFDIRHNFENISGFKQYITEAHETSSFNIGRFANSVIILPQFYARIIVPTGINDLSNEYAYCQDYSQSKLSSQPAVLILLSTLILFYFFRLFKPTKKEQKNLQIILLGFITIVVLGVLVYAGYLGRPFFDHYLTTLIPVFVIITAVVLDHIWIKSKIVAGLILFLFLFINSSGFFRLTNIYSLSRKNEAVRWAIENVNSEFSLESVSKCFRYNGYRYLFTLNDKEPVKSYVDQNFFWLYDKQPSIKHPDIVVVFVASDYVKDSNLIKTYNKYKSNEISSKKFGELEVIVADNTKEIIYDF